MTMCLAEQVRALTRLAALCDDRIKALEARCMDLERKLAAKYEPVVVAPKDPGASPTPYAALRPSIRSIVAKIAAVHGITKEHLLSRKQDRQASRARQEVYYLCHQMGNSTPRIARELGRDHSTVIAGIRAHQRRLAAAHDSDTAA